MPQVAPHRHHPRPHLHLSFHGELPQYLPWCGLLGRLLHHDRGKGQIPPGLMMFHQKICQSICQCDGEGYHCGLQNSSSGKEEHVKSTPCTGTIPAKISTLHTTDWLVVFQDQ